MGGFFWVTNMGLAAFNRMRRIKAQKIEKAKQEPDSVDELKTALTEKGITFANNAKKAELQQLWQAATESE